jgi:hypothetical protein
MKEPEATIASLVGGALVAVITITLALGAVVCLSAVTNSGLFGICGPYGDDGSIGAQIFLLAAGLIASPVLGVVFGRRFRRHLLSR